MLSPPAVLYLGLSMWVTATLFSWCKA
uniref:Uncharacterized protein n=1 Tax=Arundo donax TaxID=35708 RepID=A0A0A9A1E6_ARUDO